MTRLLMEAARRTLLRPPRPQPRRRLQPTPTSPSAALAVVEELSGKRSIAGDPFEDNSATAGGQDLQPHQQSVLDDAKLLVDRLRPAWRVRP